MERGHSGAAVRRVFRVGDGDSLDPPSVRTTRAAAQVDARVVARPAIPVGRWRRRRERRQAAFARAFELPRVVDVGGEKHVERRAVFDLGEEVAGRAEGQADMMAGVLRTAPRPRAGRTRRSDAAAIVSSSACAKPLSANAATIDSNAARILVSTAHCSRFSAEKGARRAGSSRLWCRISVMKQHVRRRAVASAATLARPRARIEDVAVARDQAAVSDATLLISGDIPKPFAITPAELKAMPRTSVTVSEEAKEVHWLSVSPRRRTG